MGSGRPTTMAAVVRTVGGLNVTIGVYGDRVVSKCALCGGTGQYQHRYAELGDDPETVAVAEALGAYATDLDWSVNRWRFIEQARRAIGALDAFRERRFDPPAQAVETDSV